MRRNYRVEAVQIILAAAIIVCAVILFFKSSELTILYPVVFGLSCILSVIYGLEGLVYNKSRVVRKSRVVIFLLLAVILAVLCFFAVRTVMG